MRRIAQILDYRWRVYAVLLVCILGIAIVKPFAMLAINGYQKHISPHKGYRCAYAALYGGPSCSEFGKRAIHDYGIIGGLMLLRQQFHDCQEAATRIRSGTCGLAANSKEADECDACIETDRERGQREARETQEYCAGCAEGFCASD